MLLPRPAPSAEPGAIVYRESSSGWTRASTCAMGSRGAGWKPALLAAGV